MKMINLWENGKAPLFDENIKDQKIPDITPYIAEGAKAAVVICPGGAYMMKAYHEGEPIAQWLNSIGVSAFVLNYRVAPYKFPAMQLDARRAVQYVRYHAADYGIDKSKIGILGFSAGGHLAASTGTIFDDYGYSTDDEVGRESFRPDFMILCYPVITMDDEYTNMGTKISLLGENAPKELSDKLSCEKRVTKEAAPAFIWHTAYDNGVHVYNSMRMAEAMRENGVEFALSIFRDGPHGLGLAEDYVDVRDWTHECELWMKSMKIIED